ncbi:proteasome activator complex subunit 4 [Dictyostelium discoideum AX4]|uniref:Proteasome activator complex subunit 4 n=1 Tax=Dictyostelium discoideum TaxID=44689 RepID=Q54DB2_DICDI|nr:proteasome activator complex subunit 4 [Dictyostelium discoideum AX4]EAL61178.1 proteasome activator complex subunit 4 [Dictyostelium discoideum AX4]|eukprot:XP_629584.1 proteasome activator complex subunit 4 [Dictyostelium discoideum AX4]
MITFKTHKDQQLNNEFISFKKEDVENTGYYRYKNCKEFQQSKRLTDEMVRDLQREKIQQTTPPSYSSVVEQEKLDLVEEFFQSFDHSIMICNIGDINQLLHVFKHRIYEVQLQFTKQQYHYLIPRLFDLFIQFRAEDLGNVIIEFLSLLFSRGKKLIELKVNWRPLYKIFKENCEISKQYGSFDDHHSTIKLQQKFNVLIYNCQPFFGGDEVVDELLEEIGGYLVPHSNYIYFCANVLYLFTPTYHFSTLTSIPKWVDLYLNYYWSWIDFNKDWDERWLFIFSRAIKFGVNIDWTPILPILYTKMLKALDLGVGSPSMAHLKPVKHKIPEIFRLTREDRMEFHSIGKIIACLINSKTEKPAIQHFKTLISKIGLYFHPSNTGDWTTDLGEMTLSMSKSFLKRNKYIPYSELIIQEFLEIIYPSLTNALYSKKKNISLTIAKIMNEFSHVAPTYILPKIIDDFYSSVDREEVNRLIGGIEVVSTCLHPILFSPQFPEGKTHLITFMEIMIKCLDPIYTNKASGTFKFFNKLFSSILISDENQYIDQCENQIEENVTLSTSLFQEWSINFVDATINFLLQSSTKKGNFKRETVPNIFFRETMELFFGALSNEIFKAVLARLKSVFTNIFEPEYYKQLGEFLKSSTLRDPIQSISVFLPVFVNKLFIKHKITNGNNNNNNNNNNNCNNNYNSGIKYDIIGDLSDQELRLYITYIGYLVFKGGHGLVEFKDQLIDILTVLMESDNKIVLKATSKVIRKLIFSLTRIYPLNTRVVPQTIVNRKENHIKYWGSTDLSTILPIEWFEPNENDINFAKLLIDKFLKGTNDKLSNYINSLRTNDESNNNNNNNTYNRMKLLNLVKPIQSILRAATFLIKDTSNEIKQSKDEFRYQPKRSKFEHGEISFPEFSTLKQEIFNNYKETIQYLESKNINEEINVLRVISKTLFVMFYCRGDIIDHTHDHLFEKWKNHKKLKGRNYLVYKAFKSHLIRQKLNFQHMPITQLALDSMHFTLNLSVHNYRRVRETAQKAFVNILNMFNGSYEIILPICIDRLLDMKSDPEIKGISFIFQAKSISRKLKGNTEWVKKLQPMVAKQIDQKFKPNTRATFSELKKVLLIAKRLPILNYYQSKEMKSLNYYQGGDIVEDIVSNNHYSCYQKGINLNSLTEQQKQLIEKASKSNKEKVDKNRSNLLIALENMVTLSKSSEKNDSLPWRNHLFLLSSIIYYFSILFNPSPGLKDGFPYSEKYKDQEPIIKEVVLCIAKNSKCDFPFSRIYCLHSIANILAVQSNKNIEFCYQNYFGDNRFSTQEKIDLEIYGSSVDFEKYLFNLTKDDIITLLFTDGTNCTANSNAGRLFAYMSQDHEESSTNSFCQSMTNKNFTPSYPNTRASVSNKDFRSFNANYFFGLFQAVGGIKFIDTIKPIMEKLKGKSEKEDYFLLVEMLAGISRYISINDDLLGDERENIFSWVSNIAFISLTGCSNECTEAWTSAIRFITHNIRFDKIEWFSNLLFEVHKKTNNILAGSKSIKFLKAFLVEVTWKNKDLTEKLFEIAKTEFSNNYKQIRIEAMRLLSLLIIYQSDFSVHPPIIPQKETSILQGFIDIISNSSPPSSGSNSPLSHVNNGTNGIATTNSADVTMIDNSNSNNNNNDNNNNSNNNNSKNSKNAIKENILLLIYFLNSKNPVLVRSAPTLLKAIMSLTGDSNLEIAKDSSGCVYRMSQEFYFESGVIDQFITVLNQTLQSPSWKIRTSILQFVQVFFFNHSFIFSNQQTDSIVNTVLALTKDPQIEIREKSKATLASILISFKSDSNMVENLIKKAIKNLNVPDQSFIEKYSSLIILSSVVLAVPYNIPKYIPSVLQQLSRYSRNSHYKTAASTISEFWRTHKESWEEDKRQFTEEEAETILSTKVAPSYFA